MYSEDDLLPISALGQFAYCERRAALLLIEGLWEENVFTAEGELVHERVHEATSESRHGLRVVRGLWLRSYRLGVYGRADVVEFRPENDAGVVALSPQVDAGDWQPHLVEYKRGRLRHEASFEIQLCAQAICLEEMLGLQIATGAVYYDRSRRRLEIQLDEELRSMTEAVARDLHTLVAGAKTPAAVYGPKCHACSMRGVCLPTVTGSTRSVQQYIQETLQKTG